MYDKMTVDCKCNEADSLEELQGHSKAVEAFLISSPFTGVVLYNETKDWLRRLGIF